jgi:hypothetical protein
MKVPVGLQARALALLALSRVLLPRVGTTTTLKRLGRRGRRRDLDPLQATRAVRRAGRLVGGLCLPQCVALTALLQRSGGEPVLVLGCRRITDGTWTAHAWVQLDKNVLEPVQGGRNAPLARLRWADGWMPSAVPRNLL